MDDDAKDDEEGSEWESSDSSTGQLVRPAEDAHMAGPSDATGANEEQTTQDSAGVSVYRALSGIDDDETISGKPFPARPSYIRFVQMPKTHQNHSYRDFTNMPRDPAGYVFPTQIEDMTFHEKLFHLLTYSTVQCRQAIDWCCHGRAFEIRNVEGLERLGILRCYFGFNGIQRFRKLLNNYGYKQLIRGVGHSDRYYCEVSASFIVVAQCLYYPFPWYSSCCMECQTFSVMVRLSAAEEDYCQTPPMNPTLTKYHVFTHFLAIGGHSILKQDFDCKVEDL